MRDVFLVTCLVVLAVGTIFVLHHLDRGTTFFYDEWDWVEGRRGGLVDALFLPHNGHLLAVPVALYRVLFAWVGLRTYGPYQAAAIAVELLCVVLVVLLIRCEVTRLLVVVAAAALLLYGPGWQDLLWPFQIAYTASLAGGLACVLFLRRHDRLGDVLATVCLVLSVASSGLGLPLLLGVAAMIAVERRWSRLWVVVVPLALYGLWYLHYGQAEVQLSNLPKLPGYVSTTSAASVGGLLGLQIQYGRFFCGVLATLLIVAVVRRRQIPPLLAFAVVSVVTMWAAFGLARGQLAEPAASRYLYPGAVLVVLAAAAVPRRRIHPVVALGLTVILPFTLWSNSTVLRDGAAGLRATSQLVKVELGALQVAGARADPAYRPDTTQMPQVSAGPYLAAVRALGSPAASVTDIEGSSEALREAADVVLVGAYHSAAVKLPLPSCPAAARHGAPPAPPATVAPGSVLLIQAQPGAAVQVSLRRFASSFPPSAELTVDAGTTFAIALPRDSVRAAWHVQVAGTGATGCAVPS